MTGNAHVGDEPRAMPYPDGGLPLTAPVPCRGLRDKFAAVHPELRHVLPRVSRIAVAVLDSATVRLTNFDCTSAPVPAGRRSTSARSCSPTCRVPGRGPRWEG